MTQKNMGLRFGPFSSPVVCYPCRLTGVLLTRMENAAKPPEMALLLSWHFFCYCVAQKNILNLIQMLTAIYGLLVFPYRRCFYFMIED